MNEWMNEWMDERMNAHEAILYYGITSLRSRNRLIMNEHEQLNEASIALLTSSSPSPPCNAHSFHSAHNASSHVHSPGTLPSRDLYTPAGPSERNTSVSADREEVVSHLVSNRRRVTVGTAGKGS